VNPQEQKQIVRKGYDTLSCAYRADETYLGVPGGKMCWSHADEATNVRWIEEAGLQVHWTRFVPEGDSGHTLVFAQKPRVSG